MTASATDGPRLRSRLVISAERPGAATATAPVAAPSAPLSLAAIERPQARNAPGPLWMRLLPSIVTACVLSIGITVPSYWRDEAATVSAVHRSFGQLLRMLGHIDAVHAAYYLLIWPISAFLGTGPLVLRLPSVIAMAAAAGVVTATGRRLVSPATGLAAGLVFAVVPSVSLYGQNARSYALVMLAAAIASYALVRALEPGARPGRWRWYAGSLTLLGILNIFGLLLIPAHCVTVLAAQRARERGRRPGMRWVQSLLPARQWVRAAGFALVVTSPLLALGYHQRHQISWVTEPAVGSLRSAVELMGPPLMTAALLVVTAIGFLAARLTGRLPALRGRAGRPNRRGPRAGPTGIIALCLPWLVLPATVLLLASVSVTPVYTFRYILFCVPAGALLAGAALTAIAGVPRRRLVGLMMAAAALAGIAALGFGQQVQYRGLGGHGDNIAEADKLISLSWRPGDAVVYANPELIDVSAAYPGGLSRLNPVQLRQAAIPSGTLSGTIVPMWLQHRRLASVPRFWVVQIDGNHPQAGLLYGMHVRRVWVWRTSNIWLELYVPSKVAWGTGTFQYRPWVGPPYYTRRVW